MYARHTLKTTGKDVWLRALPYSDWEEIEEMRIAQVEEAVALAEAGKTERVNLIMLKLNAAIRKRKLEAGLQQAAEVLGTLSTPEAREVEAIIDRLTFAEVVPENLSDAGDGSATASE